MQRIILISLRLSDIRYIYIYNKLSVKETFNQFSSEFKKNVFSIQCNRRLLTFDRFKPYIICI